MCCPATPGKAYLSSLHHLTRIKYKDPVSLKREGSL